ncbi:Hydroxyproline-rich glycoprotein family protein putative isoform 1 [Tripterygium wilfordii]|uniref:Hydroxyproline-rich glycoprotein family protein putative isoform 1 n=1 Tax=Tripterygium wilfordii TaxID=458696 RepID=A0A7J7CH59_TRIWF|nr:uncharacterized protein LOC119982944 [Tripterygium wilfordii]KAF5733376.1 Hydroxyproline-rich glycoprotein family protein putative isoform 1 [Tripterygium wilfordii]
MRAIGRRIPNPNNSFLSNGTSKNPFLMSVPYYSFSSSAGRGRGGGGPASSSVFGSLSGDEEKSRPDSTESPPPGLGHGRGRPIPSDPVLPSFSSFVSSIKPVQPGAGRGRLAAGSTQNRFGADSPTISHDSRSPDISLPTRKEEDDEVDKSTPLSQSEESNLPTSILSALPGAGRGKPVNQTDSTPQTQEDNRHLRRKPKPSPARDEIRQPQQKLSTEEAVKKAVNILSRGGGGPEEGGDTGIGRGRGGRGRGRRGRGMGGRGWRGRGRRGVSEDGEEGEFAGLELGDNADGEKLAQRLGPENMNKLVEGFEEMSSRVLPSPIDDAYLDAMHTNFLIEFEPEYLMGEFDQNPDIDEKPPIPLRDALEKAKPFLMAYEGIQSHEEWEEAVEEIMKQVPLLKEIIDYYSGPDRVTAKTQQQELERVAKTIPERAPDSVKRFADRAILSLQSNPGWGFDKKCQFMDKMAWEFSQHYKKDKKPSLR